MVLPRRFRLIAVAVALTACQVGQPLSPGKPTARRASPEVSASASATASPQAAPEPSPTSPGVAPPGVGSPPASPSPTPSVSVPDGRTRLVRQLSERLLAVAQVGFAQARTSLVAERSLLSATPVRVGLIGNNSGGILGNNSGGLIGDRTGGYRLSQGLTKAAEVSLAPLQGETLVHDRRWVDGPRTLLFGNAGFDLSRGTRLLRFTDPDTLRSEKREKPLSSWPNQAWKEHEAATTEFTAQGTVRSFLRVVSTQSDAKVYQTLAIGPDPASFVRDVATGVAVQFRRFSLDLVAGTGSFEYHYEHLGATETGTLTGVGKNAGGDYVLNYADPLGTYDGEATLRDNAGRVVFTKRQRTENGRRTRTYDLQDGLAAELSLMPDESWSGKALEAGQPVADLTLRILPTGSLLFTLTLPEEPQAPLVFGYGVLDDASPPPVAAAAAPRLQVSTLAGDPTPGFADGEGQAARFKTLFGIARSCRDENTYYLADTENHRVRTLRLAADGRVTVGTLVGTGEAAQVDGPFSSARLNFPAGLAIARGEGGCDTLYLSELTGAVRQITLAADGTGVVRTLAGKATRGGQDGPGLEATFDYPVSLAHDPAGQRLYVLEREGARVRAIDLARADHPVTTLMGGAAGFVDGPLASARLDAPQAIALDASGRLCLADGGNKRLRAFDPRAAAPELQTVAGSGVLERSFLDGRALDGGLNPPRAVFILPGGGWLTGAADVRLFLPASGALKTVAGGLAPGVEDGGPETARFREVRGFELGPDGALLVLDGHRVRLIRPPVGAAELLR